MALRALFGFRLHAKRHKSAAALAAFFDPSVAEIFDASVVLERAGVIRVLVLGLAIVLEQNAGV